MIYGSGFAKWVLYVAPQINQNSGSSRLLSPFEFLPMHFHYPVQIGGEIIELEFLNGLFHQQGSNPNLQMILFQYPEIKYQDDF